MWKPIVLSISLVAIVLVAMACEHHDKSSPKPVTAMSPANSQAPTGTRPFSVANQEAIADVASPNSLFAKRLPADVMNHRMADDAAIAVSALNADAGGSTNVMIWAHSGSRNDINGIPTYYGQATDPAYVITGGPSANGQYSAINKPFHAPNQAFTNGAESESFLMVWDQVQDKYIYLYRFGAGHQSFARCTSTDLNNPCPIGFDPSTSIMNDRNEPDGYGVSNSPESTGFVAPVTHIRVNEMMQGHINHAIYMNVLCEQNQPNNLTGQAGNYVFPATASAASCHYICSLPNSSCTNTDKAPAAGALFFLDYTDAQLGLLKSYLPAWQYPIVEALTHYGGYAGDTGNPLHPSRMESGDAYALAGLDYPILSWLQGQPGVPKGCSPTGQCNLPWSNLGVAGNSCPAAGLCDITQHIHIADPCVLAGMAGVTAGAGIDSSHPPCEGVLQVTVVGAGRVKSDPAGIDCGPDGACNMVLSNGAKVALAAIPAPGHKFEGWKGVCRGKSECTVTVDGRRGMSMTIGSFR